MAPTPRSHIPNPFRPDETLCGLPLEEVVLALVTEADCPTCREEFGLEDEET